MDTIIDNTFTLDFTIADAFGVDAVKDTYNRAFKEWKHDYKMLTALVVTLNHKIWEHYKAENHAYAQVYNDLWEQAQDYAWENLKGDELKYYYNITD